MLILPFVALLLVFGILLARSWSPAARPGEGLRLSWIQSVTLVGAVFALASEALSLARALTTGGVVVFWALVDLLLLALFWPRAAVLRRRLMESRVWEAGWTGAGKAVVAALGLLVLVLLGNALLSQPSTVDSLLYHMPRVAHWAQGRSLAPYPTQYGNQIWLPPFAEEVILHLRLLGGGDGTASLVQWFAYVSLLVVVSALIRVLGGGLWAELAGTAFFASLPMALLQATSTQNDLVSALWLLVLAHFVVVATRRPLSVRETVALGAAAGLGLLTKATLYIIEAPLLLWYASVVLRRNAPWQGRLVALGGAAAVAAMVNVGYWWRNVATSGGLFGPAALVRMNTNVHTGVQALGNIASAILRALAVHSATPFPELNERLIDAVASLTGRPGMTGLEFTLIWSWNDEDFATAPIHLALALLGIGACIVSRHWRGMVKGYLVAGLAGALLFAMLLPYSGHPNGLRYHLALLALAAPAVGLTAERSLPGRPVRLFSMAMMVLAIPYALFNSARPLVGMTADPEGLEIPCVLGCTAVGSVLDADPIDVLFAHRRELQGPYTQVADAARARGCRAVGLRIDSHDPEYVFWRLLRPGEGWRIESVYSLDELRPLIDPGFRPCAVICTICAGREYLHGLPLVFNAEGVSLFAGPGFHPDPDAEPPGG